MKKIRLMYLGVFSFLLLFATACDEDDKPDLPTSALIHYSVVERQVAFTALAHNADSYMWDFGDGQTSTEPNPVHVYQDGGYYKAVLTVQGGTGSATDEADLAIALTPYVLLTGGPTAANGKTWRLSGSHSEFDYFAYSDPTLSPFPGAPKPLPAGILGAGLGLGEVYIDEFTFYFDGMYEHDVKDDNASYAGIVNQLQTNGGAGVVNWSSDTDFGQCTAKYTPEAGATFTFTEGDNYDVPSVFDPSDGVVTYEDVTTIDFSGTEFVGFMDVQRKVIVQEIKDNSMRLVLFMTGDMDYYPLNTNALILTFEVVK